MNAPIAKLFALVVVLFATLIGFTSYWAVFDKENLEANRLNRRPLLEQARIPRGLIFARSSEVLARNVKRGSGSDVFYRRTYPTGPLFGHPVGYSSLQLGRAGIERYYNDDLVGQTNEFASTLDELRGKRPVGDDLHTTLDPSAQRTALQALAGQSGAVVAIEPQTGRVRVLASVPTYDPNLIDVPGGYRKLRRSPDRVLFDRATQSGYPPGSTFKLITATAALDTKRFTPDSVINGDSPKVISGVPLQNSGGQSFGPITMTQALTFSVNTVWAQVAEQLGKQAVYKYMDRYGFNRKPPIDLPTDELVASGVYKGADLLTASDDVDIGRVAIGQERLRVTPLQMAMVVSAIANSGKLERPRLVERITDRDGGLVEDVKPQQVDTVMSRKTATELAVMMSKVVQEGTGTAAALSGIPVAGKTGTAERGDANQAWFVGFAPVQRPRIAIAVTVERTSGQGGTVAAPIAKQVMQELLQ